jgi:NAD(P)-dependent dehydrogenase (short-subunit alcohol dehydrogenase family)
MKIDVSSKMALVTGSTAGIGLAIAKGLATAGTSVIVNGRPQPGQRLSRRPAAMSKACLSISRRLTGAAS